MITKGSGYMKFKTKLTVFFSALLLCALTVFLGLRCQRRQVIRVACVGDSITYGAGISNISKNSYPARLQSLLGNHYQVKNYGASGYTMQKAADYPYWEHPDFQESLDFQPDIVLLMLGTNDGKTYNWVNAETFLTDYKDMIRCYQALESNPKIYLMTPATVFSQNTDPAYPDNQYSISADNVEEITQLVRDLASELNLPLIDIHKATKDYPEFFPEDGVHPNAQGAAFIAQQVYEALKD